MRLLPPRYALLIGCALWLLTATSGMAVLWSYGSTAGTAAHAPSKWPVESSITRAPGRPTLLVFAHPQCPCTRASIEEVDRVLASIDERPDVHILFTKPAGTAPGWADTDLWHRAAAIPDVTVTRDDGGREAQRFGVATSGQVLLYDGGGDLRFAGGVTPSRGHAGDSTGRSALRALLSARDTTERTTPVFGCALAGSTTPVAFAARTLPSDGPGWAPLPAHAPTRAFN